MPVESTVPPGSGSLKPRCHPVSIDCVKLPLPWNALQLALAPLLEDHVRAYDEVRHGPRDQDLPRPGQCADTRPDDNCEPTHFVGDSLDLARVDADSDLESEPRDDLDEPHRASGRQRWSVECHEEPVPRRRDLSSSVPSELAPDDGVETLEQVRPSSVADLRSSLRGVDDVDEHHRCQDALGLGAIAHPGEKLLDLLDGPLISDPRPVVRARKRDELRPGHVIGNVLAFFERNCLIVSPMQNERGDTDGGEDVTDVDLLDHPSQGHRGAGARGKSLKFGEPLHVAPVAHERRHEVFQEQRAAAPVSLEVVEPLPIAWRRRPWVGRTSVALATEGPVGHDGSRPLGMGSGEQEGHGSGLRDAHDRGPLRSHRVHQGGDVIDPVLEQPRPTVGGAIRKTRPSLIENDQAGERGQPPQEPGQGWIFP